MDVREDVPAARNHQSQGRRHYAESHGPPAPARAPFLIHMSSRGLDDNRYVVERYKSTFDGEIVRWPCKGKSKTGKQPHKIMSLGAVQRVRPERDEIIVCTGVKIAGFRHPVIGDPWRRACSRSAGARGSKRPTPGDVPPATNTTGRPDTLRQDHTPRRGGNMPYKDPEKGASMRAAAL